MPGIPEGKKRRGVVLHDDTWELTYALATATGRGLCHQVEVILCQYFAALDEPRNAIECDPWDEWARAEHRWP